jgi:hypothetical protein
VLNCDDGARPAPISTYRITAHYPTRRVLRLSHDLHRVRRNGAALAHVIR